MLQGDTLSGRTGISFAWFHFTLEQVHKMDGIIAGVQVWKKEVQVNHNEGPPYFETPPIWTRPSNGVKIFNINNGTWKSGYEIVFPQIRFAQDVLWMKKNNFLRVLQVMLLNVRPTLTLGILFCRSLVRGFQMACWKSSQPHNRFQRPSYIDCKELWTQQDKSWCIL